MTTFNKKVTAKLTDFKDAHVDKNLQVGHLYILNKKDIFSKIEGFGSIKENYPILILKIVMISSIDYFNLGPAILISFAQDEKKYQVYIGIKQIESENYVKNFPGHFTELF